MRRAYRPVYMAHILAIDDDEGFRDYLTVMLERAGHAVCALANGASAAQVVAAGGIDAVLTDLYMPRADGIETIRALRAVSPDLPVICISGGGWESRDPCLKIMQVLGAVVLEKPLRREELLNTLDRLLAQRRPPG
jgi:DNA-binding NtrC family response regulator